MFKVYHKLCILIACLWLSNAIITTYTLIEEPERTTIGIPYIILPIINWILVIWWIVMAFIKGN